jgi:hypothetical protein
MTRLNLLARPAVLLGALALTGCGSGTTDLTGKVTYQGKTVVYGSVVVIDSSGAPKSGTIQPDGTYRVSGVRTGAVKVAVSSPPPPGSQPAAKPDPRDADDKPPAPPVPPAPPEVIKNWFQLPNKYGDPNQSGLTGDAKSGQSFDLDLK